MESNNTMTELKKFIEKLTAGYIKKGQIRIKYKLLSLRRNLRKGEI